MVVYQHKFNNGEVIRVCDRPFPEVKKEVLTIEFEYVRGGAIKTQFARLYDFDTGEDLGKSLFEALKERYGVKGRPNQLVPTKEKLCKDCQQPFTPKSYSQKRCITCAEKSKVEKKVIAEAVATV